MNRLYFLLLVSGLVYGSVPALASPDRIIIAKVRGEVRLKQNQPAKPGTFLQSSDFLIFTHLDQGLVCLHPKLGKLVFKPFSNLQVNTRVSVADLLIPYQGQRGQNNSDEVQHFQTLKDSLRLSLTGDLKIKPATRSGEFQLYDLRMKSTGRKPKADTGGVWTYADKKATYFLHYVQASGSTKTVAEIEFMEPDEIRNELKYMAQLVTASEAKAKKEEYLARQYKSLSAEERRVLLGE